MTDGNSASKPISTRLILLAATGLGMGRIPFAPGTFGSVLGVGLVWALYPLSWFWYVAAALAVIALGVPLCTRAARELHSKDPAKVVYDEIAAFPLMYLATPFNPQTALAGFVLFRIFDITKPWPVRRLEQLPAGLGIMADDLAAGAYAGIALYGVARWLLPG